MSLKHVAHHLASKGRGPDRTLVHMSPREVGGLQALAKAHGGSLTINPETGLVEAGFLERLLPTLAGAALASTGIGAPMAALMVGGGVGLAKGDLKAGLMAGLGAYGGAGLAGGAATLGAQQAGEQAGANALGTTTEAMATEQGANQALTTSYPDMAGNITPETSFIDPTKGQAYSQAYSQAAQPNFANMQTGAQQAVSSPEGFGKYVDATGGGAQTAKYGFAAAAPSMIPDAPKLPEEEKYDGPLSKYRFDPDKYRSADRSQPNPYYQPVMYRYGYAEGGPVERMSNQNEVGMNTGYPGADINQGAYATPYQTPISRNVVTGATDASVNPMNGEMRLAEGGITGSGNLDLHIPLDLGGGGQGGGQGGSQRAYAMQGGEVGMPGFAGSQPQAFGGGQGAFGGMQQPQPMQQSNPFAGDENWNNYQTQMQGMFNDFQNSDQYKNMDQLRQTMLNYQQQRMGMLKPTSLAMAEGGMAYAGGGISTLGGYSDGGRLLKGPGDGMSDNIPAQIGSKQPARLADGEFVVPADVVSHLGNGSTDAGARQLYSMMDRIRAKRTGKKKQAPKVNPSKAMPA